MALAQKDMVAGPDAMIVRGGLVRMTMAVIMPVIVVMIMPMGVTVGMPVCVQGMVVRHTLSLARYRCKVA